MAELCIEGLTKAFGRQQVLRHVSLDVRAGGLTAILGASGSGKTTLLRLLCGFDRIDAGTVRIGGRLVAGAGVHVPPERRQIGYVAQEGALFPHLSVADNIVFALPRRQRRARHRVGELLELVGLPVALAGRAPHQLSGGEQQRVALARALAPEPRLVLLDEPFSALDAALRAETRQGVAAALAAAGATALLVTHDQSEALSMGDEVAVLRRGALVQVAPPAILYQRPVDAELACFVGEAVLLPGVASGGGVTCALGRLPLAPGMPEGEVAVMIRPEQIRLAPGHDGEGVAALVREAIFYGHDASVRVALCGRGGTATLTARVPGHMGLRRGDAVRLAVEGAVVAYRRPDAGAVPPCRATMGAERMTAALGPG